MKAVTKAMAKRTAGIHHVTAYAGDVQTNVDFYAGILGLRLVKRTVNFDAPEMYHLYFGNETGSPGTAMTFFPYDWGRRGRIGGGQVGHTAFAVPPGALPFWENRLERFSVPVSRMKRFGETYLRFRDPDGLQLELVVRGDGPRSKWAFGEITPDNAIKGFGGAVLYSTAPAMTMHALEHVMGLERVGEDGGVARFRASAGLGNLIDVHLQALGRGRGGPGTVHHIAWRAADREDQEDWRAYVAERGFQPTPIVDRNYFTSLYFREKGGVLFEIATDPPGFARDEPPEALGEKLMLPEWYEPYRERIERALPPIEVRAPD